jgi:SAM-dependent methyltransferase
MRAPPVTAQNIRLVDWAPNHVRAWTRILYDRVGGHDITLSVGDDHDLIVRCFLAGAKFHHIQACLYYYRVHKENAVKQKNAEIRDATWGVYNRYIWALAEKWAHDNNLSKIDLCGGLDRPAAYTALDRYINKDDRAGGLGIVCDLETKWPLEDNSVGVLRAHDALEHLHDPIHILNEAYRVLAPGGFLFTHTPSTDGRGAFQDPTHVSFWNENSFAYYCDPAFMRYIPKFKGRFQLIKNITWFPSDWHREKKIPYCEAHLIKLSDGYTPMGALS